MILLIEPLGVGMVCPEPVWILWNLSIARNQTLVSQSSSV